MMTSAALLLAVLVPADTVREREVTIPGPVPLAGVLTLPASGRAPYPALVIVHGSGGGDRDGTLGPNRPYRDLARGLAERGIAVLRYDKRSGVKPFWFLGKSFTVRDETIDDALSALEVLRSQPEVDPTRIVLLGHSLGGLLAPQIAELDDRLAGLVLFAGAWVGSLPELILTQLDYIASVSQPSDTLRVVSQRRVIRHHVERINAMTLADSSDLVLYLGAPASYWLDLREYDAVATLRSRPEPTLILQGGRDYQVTPAMLDEFLAALGEREHTTVVRYPALNHLFIAGSGVPGPADYSIAGVVDVRVVEDLAAWIGRIAPRKSGTSVARPPAAVAPVSPS